MQQCMQLTSTNRPFGLTIKFTRCRNSCQYSVASSQLEPELEPAMLLKLFEPG